MKRALNSGAARRSPAPRAAALPSAAARAATAAAVPLLYGLLFLILTWPSAVHLGTHILADGGDGLQMYWNIWWVRHAVLSGRLDVYETPMLFYPQSPSLLAHSLHPFGGLLTVPLAAVCPDIVLFNLVVIFAFAASGWGAFLLARRFGAARLPALAGGYIFTFCSYHFAHAQGHLNLVLMQWIPFFLLYFLRVVEDGRARHAVLAALFLVLVLLCDHYYFSFCVLAGALTLLWAAVRGRPAGLSRPALRSWLLFGSLVASTAGVFIYLYLQAVAAGDIAGHQSRESGMDLFALLIPGAHWRWHGLTAFYWERLGANIHETSVHVGLGAAALAVCGYIDLRRRRDRTRLLLLLWFLVFFLLALGRELQVFGWRMNLPMPYDALEFAVPPLRTGGVPVRFVVVAILALSVLAARGAGLLAATRGGRLALALLCGLVCVELYPRPVPVTRVTFPAYIDVLARHATTHPGPILDLVHPQQLAMVYQTRHQQPIHTGYLARIPQPVRRSFVRVNHLIERQAFAELGSQWGFRYVLATTAPPDSRLLFGGPVQIYELTSRPVAP